MGQSAENLLKELKEWKIEALISCAWSLSKGWDQWDILASPFHFAFTCSSFFLLFILSALKHPIPVFFFGATVTTFIRTYKMTHYPYIINYGCAQSVDVSLNSELKSN